MLWVDVYVMVVVDSSFLLMVVVLLVVVSVLSSRWLLKLLLVVVGCVLKKLNGSLTKTMLKSCGGNAPKPCSKAVWGRVGMFPKAC